MDYSRLPDPHPPVPPGNNLNWEDHVNRMIARGELTEQEGKKLKRRVKDAGVGKYDYTKNKSSK